MIFKCYDEEEVYANVKPNCEFGCCSMLFILVFALSCAQCGQNNPLIINTASPMHTYGETNKKKIKVWVPDQVKTHS